jgi:glycine/D-amino acid oxidase-like deaminating enzyme
MSKGDRIVVLGAGLQGLCVSLELALRGYRVDLVERDLQAFNRTSLRGEGKIHLGLVYALDPSLRTARLMLDAALRFRPLLSRWISDDVDRIPLSSPFHYLVAKDSLCSVEQLSRYYGAVEDDYQSRRRRSDVDYLGASPERLTWPLAETDYRDFVCAERVVAGFGTAEVSIDLAACAAALRRAAAAAENVELYRGHEVVGVSRRAWGFHVEGVRNDGSSWSIDGDQVVNALWDGRLAIDEAMGLRAPFPWVHRLKYRMLVELPPRLRSLPSMTFVLGAFGDIVTYPDSPTYVSWYPECMQGWSTDLRPPQEWEAVCSDHLDGQAAEPIANRILSAFDRYVPGLIESRVAAVDAGVIFAWGRTDISELESGLHQRDAIGPSSFDGYHTINTGKLTTAPMFAVETAERVSGQQTVAGP